MCTKNNFLIIGAGPKALAVVAKAYVLQKVLGISMPNFHIIERNEIGGNWTGKNGFTNGKLKLGTSPQKDIGFPYQTKHLSPETSQEINFQMRRFSWDSFLISRGKYGEWIDRGRPNPTHCEWAQYLKFGFELLGNYMTIHYGEISQISYSASLFTVQFERSNEISTMRGGHLLITGPGEAARKTSQLSERVFDINSYWKKIPMFSKEEKVLIVGGGENSATVALDLVNKGVGKDVMIDIATPTGFLHTRGESFFENRIYTDSDNGPWKELSKEEKHAFIKKTDMGVYSVAAMKELDQNGNLNVVKGLVSSVSELDDNVIVNFSGQKTKKVYQRVIWANGFKKTGLLQSKIDEVSKIVMEEEIGEVSDGNLSGRIAQDLSVDGLQGKLYLPMVAGINQGPGFSNLSSLGKLSDRVLSSYIKSTQRGLYEISH